MRSKIVVFMLALVAFVVFAACQEVPTQVPPPVALESVECLDFGVNCDDDGGGGAAASVDKFEINDDRWSSDEIKVWFSSGSGGMTVTRVEAEVDMNGTIWSGYYWEMSGVHSPVTFAMKDPGGRNFECIELTSIGAKVTITIRNEGGTPLDRMDKTYPFTPCNQELKPH